MIRDFYTFLFKRGLFSVNKIGGLLDGRLPRWFFPFTALRFRLYRMIIWSFERLDESMYNMSQSLPSDESSNPVSLMLRPILEHRRFQGIFGFGLVFVVVFFAYFGSPILHTPGSAFADFPSGASVESQDLSVVGSSTDVVLTTERRYQMPVELIGVSQEFHIHHPGVDLRAAYGSNIAPITEGVVREVVRSSGGYGQAVIIDHSNNVSSMYAHVQRIFVDTGSPVDQQTVIAEIGMTGYSTGPHLHLEIYNNGAAVNPQPYLGY